MNQAREPVTPEEDNNTPHRFGAALREEWPALAFGLFMLLILLGGAGRLLFSLF